MSRAWDQPVRLAELDHGPVRLRLEPDAETRAAIARRLGLRGLPMFHADLELRPWLDGAELRGRFQARVEQVCGVSLEPFEDDVDGEVDLRFVPEGSPNAPVETEGENPLDLDAPDPPDLLSGDAVDVAECLVEHLALELDPFPRKPGASFDFQPGPEGGSPFGVLRRLKGDDE